MRNSSQIHKYFVARLSAYEQSWRHSQIVWAVSATLALGGVAACLIFSHSAILAVTLALGLLSLLVTAFMSELDARRLQHLHHELLSVERTIPWFFGTAIQRTMVEFGLLLVAFVLALVGLKPRHNAALIVVFVTLWAVGASIAYRVRLQWQLHYPFKEVRSLTAERNPDNAGAAALEAATGRIYRRYPAVTNAISQHGTTLRAIAQSVGFQLNRFTEQGSDNARALLDGLLQAALREKRGGLQNILGPFAQDAFKANPSAVFLSITDNQGLSNELRFCAYAAGHLIASDEALYRDLRVLLIYAARRFMTCLETRSAITEMLPLLERISERSGFQLQQLNTEVLANFIVGFLRAFTEEYLDEVRRSFYATLSQLHVLTLQLQEQHPQDEDLCFVVEAAGRMLETARLTGQ